jgi:hypothetical protein
MTCLCQIAAMGFPLLRHVWCVVSTGSESSILSAILAPGSAQADMPVTVRKGRICDAEQHEMAQRGPRWS